MNFAAFNLFIILNMPGIVNILGRHHVCYSVIVYIHGNHPGGDIKPSPQDKSFTKELHDAGKLMDVKLIDHVIVGNDEYFSFADEGIVF